MNGGARCSREALEDIGWDDVAATYHAYSRWQGVESNVADDRSDAAHGERLERMRRVRGDPPSHFVQRADALGRTALRTPALAGRVLRCTPPPTHGASLRCSHAAATRLLETVLFSVFAAHGLKEFAPGISAIRRTSPSGGALHPIEAYVLVRHIDGLPPGLYHYETGAHALALLEHLTREDVARLIEGFTAGQTYFADAHAAIVHVARFDRNMWKYRRHRKSYKAVMMDSAHLSQTLYLTVAHLGLGAFYTAAINDADVGVRLRLDPQRELPSRSAASASPNRAATTCISCPTPIPPTVATRKNTHGHHADSGTDQGGAHAAYGIKPAFETL